MYIKLTAACVAVAGLAACETATPPTAGQAEYNAALAQYNAVVSNQRAAASSLSGFTTFTGTAISNAEFAEEGGYRMIGDMEMRVDFNDNNGDNIRGEIEEINIIDRRNADGSQLAEGVLNIRGTEVNGQIVATATGELGIVRVDSIARETTNVDLDLEGETRNTSAFADTITGRFSGFGAASTTNGVEAEFTGGRFVLDDPSR
ncbi:hypothetical protein [Yoonia sp. 208BN28-4]|uniref:hypothetical protein n=1 Tax=Yoonia sp. 208BN28-4 TaxID=3126505 RepID=UPI0030B09998